ncbi:MAG TPA: YihY/virulence factor BrkB family protein [Burkholderiaceae bacterium]|nr:YihY/virulence factor BrkB family protein [Burkholderiaceae bacterium]
MKKFAANARKALRHPVAFALAVLKQFRANQGLLLAGAVAYYALLSLVPLLILVVLALTQIFDEAVVLKSIGTYLEFVVPGQSNALVGELQNFLMHRELVGWLLLALMLFFSTLAFTVLENAMLVIFFHRVTVRPRRHFLVSALMPYLFVLSLAIGLMIITVVSGALGRLGTHAVIILGESRPLDEFSARLLYLIGVGGEVLLLTAIYLVMPVGRLSLRHALIGGTAAAILWEITRHVLVWYYSTISQIQVVYGSLTTSIAVLLSVEIGAIFLLLGAQVIAEYERIGYEPINTKAKPMQAEKA